MQALIDLQAFLSLKDDLSTNEFRVLRLFRDIRTRADTITEKSPGLEQYVLG